MILLALAGLGLAGYRLWEMRVDLETIQPASLRVGVLPDQAPEVLRRFYAPLLAHLSRVTGLRTELHVPADYAELRDRFIAGEIDLAWFGGLTFVQAHLQAGARPLVMRDVDTRFTSAYLVRGASTGKSLADFRGRRMAFGDRLSTSGHLMPRLFMQDAGIVPEEFFGAVEYSGAHDRTVEMVRDGAVDIGVANHAIVQSMFESDRVSTADVVVLAETLPYVDYVWATRSSLHPATVASLLEAFLQLSLSDPEHRAILAAQRCSTYLPASSHEFDNVMRAGRDADLLR